MKTKEEMDLKCTEKVLAWANDECETEWVSLVEFRLPWNDYHFSNHRFFIVRHRVMDWDSACWDRFYNDIRSAMAAFGKEAAKKCRYGDGHTEKAYGKVGYCEDWWSYREEIRELSEVHADERRYRSASSGDYGPGNPWNAPGMSVSDFIRGVY